MTREFKYYPEDFGALTVKVKHMDLSFDMYEKYSNVSSNLQLMALENINSLDLNAKNLEINVVSVDACESTFEYLEDEDILRINFAREISKDEDFVIHTETVCRPTSNTLEGLYYDETPKGCPCQQITQCQQWGFQRIVPCIDDMTAKCTYTTEITADERYTNLISNGDVSMKVESVGEGRAQIKYDNMITPMATYLFFLGVGSYETFEKEFVYPDGDKFMLELLVPPGSDKAIAEKALQVLHDAILWIYLFTGPGKYENWDRSMKIWSGYKIDMSGMKFGYKYTGTVYREIGMQNSDFGGMENVGNTTITTNRIMPFPEMTDGSFEYMIRVKAHEFYHNLNGSEVTGQSPFEIWLNEAVTVFIEQEYHEFVFGREYSRLDTVLTLLAPGGGTFAGDDNVAAMPIEPDGFNDCNELITGVTYVKAPEFVKMIETLMGPELFVKGLDLYHTRYKHSNASSTQWMEAMEEACGKDFKRMAKSWLKQASYPKLDVVGEYNTEARKYVLKLKQNGFNEGLHWEFPIICALCDKDGEDLSEKMQWVQSVESEIVFEDVDEPAFLSLNRNYSFFGKVYYEVSEENLYLQVRKDKDLINRFMAFYRLSESEKMRILEGGVVSEKFVDLYFELLSDEDLMAHVGVEILTIFEAVEDEKFAHAYRDLYEAVKSIKRAVGGKYRDKLVKMYKGYASREFDGSYLEVESKKIKTRQVKNTCLALLAKLEDEEIYKMIREQFENAECATDKVTAFSLYLNSKAPDKIEVLEAYESEASKNLVSWESFLACVSGNDSDDMLNIIKRVEKSESFRIDQANDQRALYARFAGNRKRSLLTSEGREFLKESILKLAPINEYSCLYVLKPFGNIDKIAAEHQADLVKVLMDVKAQLDPKKVPSVYNTLERILKGSPKGVKRYEDSLKA